MKKKTAKKKAAKQTENKSEQVNESAEPNPAKMLHDLSLMIEHAAPEITNALIGESKKGQPSPAKYLFEMAHIYPPATDGSQTSKDEESLAETLLDRLKIPKTPVVHDELQKEEDEDLVVIQPVKETPEEAKGNGEEEDEADAVAIP